MALLLDEDYERLRALGTVWEEMQERRFLILKCFPLEPGLYTVAQADVLVVIEPNYPEAGHDMFWTAPHLIRSDGLAIPQTSPPGAGENHKVNDVEFHRWSRHWFPDMPGCWKPGVDNVDTIVRRLTWALKNQPLT